TILLLVTYSPFAATGFIGQAQRTAKLYALAAGAQAGGAVLDPHTTFEPNRPASIELPQTYFSNQGYIQYNGTRSSATQTTSAALLIAPNGQVLASTYPAGYPATTPVANLLPGRSDLITNALRGRAGGTIVVTPQGNIACDAETVWSGGKAIGAVYVQIPEFSGWTLLQGITQVWLFSGLFLLILTLLVGALFGLITTRGVVRRLRHLAVATTRFADGDYTQRVKVSRRDEVGQLEEQFNRMAEQLVESITQRQALAGQNARMAERNRLARDLHDSVKQQAFAVSMQLGAARSLLDLKPKAARQHLEEAENLAHQVQRELATLIQELRPLALQYKGLAAALREYVTKWSRQQGIAADIHIEDGCAISLEAEEALWRVAQEALSNIARHSQASSVQISLTCEQGKVLLSITDDGWGFDTAGKAAGVGLHSMQERMQALGGKVTVESKIGGGTRVLAQCLSSQVQAGVPAERPSEASQQ
ncbi:MAG: sensor histidine kinase, partial [Chloroflexi bacterium]|nr:sensor histidine kinase [Chloroflexota bacterium]